MYNGNRICEKRISPQISFDHFRSLNSSNLCLFLATDNLIGLTDISLYSVSPLVEYHLLSGLHRIWGNNCEVLGGRVGLGCPYIMKNREGREKLYFKLTWFYIAESVPKHSFTTYPLREVSLFTLCLKSRVLFLHKVCQTELYDSSALPTQRLLDQALCEHLFAKQSQSCFI